MLNMKISALKGIKNLTAVELNAILDGEVNA